MTTPTDEVALKQLTPLSAAASILTPCSVSRPLPVTAIPCPSPGVGLLRSDDHAHRRGRAQTAHPALGGRVDPHPLQRQPAAPRHRDPVPLARRRLAPIG